MYNLACNGWCQLSRSRRPDLDFGAPPLLARNSGGREPLYVGQKPGAVSALDPSTENEFGIAPTVDIWGVHWGLAADINRGLLYVPISDFPAGLELTGVPAPGLYALSLDDGSLEWFAEKDFSELNRKKLGFWPGVSA